jgi:hypothetical protein
MRRMLCIMVFAALLIGGCSSNKGVGSGDQASGTVCLWIGADKDAYVTCGRTVGCEEGDHNHGQDIYLVVAGWELAHKRSYVHFLLPILPEGTEIMEAYLEFHHPGKNEDGNTDNVDIPVQKASGDWSPMDLTWNNQPAFTPSQLFTIDLKSQAWSGSSNIVAAVTDMFGDPESDYGFVLWWTELTGVGIEKGFHSNNCMDRTASDLGSSPRLLVKIKLPSGKTTSDISLPALPLDNDLPFEGQEILMLRFSSGSNWPEDWDVTVGS